MWCRDGQSACMMSWGFWVTKTRNDTSRTLGIPKRILRMTQWNWSTRSSLPPSMLGCRWCSSALQLAMDGRLDRGGHWVRAAQSYARVTRTPACVWHHAHVRALTLTDHHGHTQALAGCYSWRHRPRVGIAGIIITSRRGLARGLAWESARLLRLVPTRAHALWGTHTHARAASMCAW